MESTIRKWLGLMKYVQPRTTVIATQPSCLMQMSGNLTGFGNGGTLGNEDQQEGNLSGFGNGETLGESSSSSNLGGFGSGGVLGETWHGGF